MSETSVSCCLKTHNAFIVPHFVLQINTIIHLYERCWRQHIEVKGHGLQRSKCQIIKKVGFKFLKRSFFHNCWWRFGFFGLGHDTKITVKFKYDSGVIMGRCVKRLTLYPKQKFVWKLVTMFIKLVKPPFDQKDLQGIQCHMSLLCGGKVQRFAKTDWLIKRKLKSDVSL